MHRGGINYVGLYFKLLLDRRSFRRAYELAFAMECRCYNGNNRRTRMKIMKFSYRDAVAFVVIAVMLAGIILLNHFFGAVI